MRIGGNKAVGAIATTVLSLSVLGASVFGSGALAAPSAPDASQIFAAETRPERAGFARIEAVLSGLVEKGVITATQKDAIVDAFKRAKERHHGDRDLDVRRFLGNVLEQSSNYLELPVEAIKGQLQAGKSLGEIANQRPGKSREGLIDALQKAAHERIRQAVEDKKITPEQAERLRTAVDTIFVKVVDHEGGRKK